MRRLNTLCIVVGLVLASAAPAGAAPIKAEPIEVVECMVPGDFAEAKIWFSGQDDKIMHIRGLVNTAFEFLFNDSLGTWVPIGTNEIGVNYNGAWVAVPDFGPAPTVGTYWGTFDLELEGIGEFTGTWSWGKGAVDGRGSGSGDGQLIKVDLLGEDPGWPGGYPDGCGFVEYTVKTK
ncbi:MAG: hypothetical protein HKO63_05145 [Acidimicrobiia bacterium]|nr:hypothetical protein [Acidimicrobiia bacterium]